jgi:hypothetical protein
MQTIRCDGVKRRDVLRVGVVAGFGLNLPLWLRSRATANERAAAATAKAKSCILIWLDGGPSHLETFDPKPDAPAEVRGPLGTIATALSGVRICDQLPHLAKLMKDIALIRSVTSPLGEHNFGTHYLMTGYKPTPVLEYPSYGSVVAQVRGQRGVLPPHVAVPNFQTGGGRFSGGGFLPEQFRPFSVGGDPARPDFAVRDLEFFPAVTPERLRRRRDFLADLDRFRRAAEEGAEAEKETAAANSPLSDPQFEQAYRLVTSPEAKKAFDLSAEKPEVRGRYGPRTIGQSGLLARRLVERGVPFVTVNNVGWDTHDNLYTRLKEGYTGAKVPVGLIPSLDLALAALLEDLKVRGLLDETLVLVMGEFGRTPKLNTLGGRDHWPRVFSVLAAGGGVRGGQVIGSSDAVGESPKDRPVTPADLACTIYALLGIAPTHELHTADGRPVRVSQEGEVVRELLA